MAKRRRRLLWISVPLLLFLVGVAIAARVIRRRIEPFIREKTVDYLRQRFDSDVEIARVTMVRLEGLRITVPPKGPSAYRAENSTLQTSDKETAKPSVFIDTIIADGAQLFVLLKDPKKGAAGVPHPET